MIRVTLAIALTILVSACSITISSVSSHKLETGYSNPLVVFVNYNINSYNLYNHKVEQELNQKAKATKLPMVTHSIDVKISNKVDSKYKLDSASIIEIQHMVKQEQSDVLILVKPRGVGVIKDDFFEFSQSGLVTTVQYFIEAYDVKKDSIVWKANMRGGTVGVTDKTLKNIGKYLYKRMEEDHLIKTKRELRKK
jgi:hypothetical protein